MKAAILLAPHTLDIISTPIPIPKPGEVRIKLKMIGICGSDVHVFLGHRLLDHPTVIGHEGLGYIDMLGNGVEDKAVGDRVVIEPNIPCRACEYCLSGRGNICVNKKVIGINSPGCFAEYITIPAQFCWTIPDDISDEDAVTIEPMAVGYHALMSSKARPGDTIAVIGLGAIGLLLTHLALSLGYRTLVSEIHASKLKTAIDLGAIPADIISGSALANLWKEHKVTAIFECAGSDQTASLATEAAPRGSEIILVGLSEKLATFRPLKIAREGITIVPSIIYDHPFDFRRTIQLISAKIIHPGFIISKYMNLIDLQSAMETAALGEESKIIIMVH